MNRALPKHPYLYWIQKTARKKQAVLLEPRPTNRDTPEYFYYFEQEVRSSLLHRAYVRGLVTTSDESHH